MFRSCLGYETLESREATRVAWRYVGGSRGTNSSTQLQTTHDPAGLLFLCMLHGYVCPTCRHTLCIYTHAMCDAYRLCTDFEALLYTTTASVANLCQPNLMYTRMLDGHHVKRVLPSGPTGNAIRGCWLRLNTGFSVTQPSTMILLVHEEA